MTLSVCLSVRINFNQICCFPQIRLVDGLQPQSGRIEVRHKSIWGTICDDHFGPNEAAVVCRMLGYDDTDAKVYNGSQDYRGSGPVWIRLSQDDVCSGFETSIEQCKVGCYIFLPVEHRSCNRI